MPLTSISLETTNVITCTNCANGYIEIHCVVNGEQVAEIIEIELIRLDVSILSVSKTLALERNDYVSNFEDTELANRSGVVVSSLIRYGDVSYLSIRIMGSVVKPQKDKGPYQCVLRGFDTNYGFIREDPRREMLNITGNTNNVLLIHVRPGL